MILPNCLLKMNFLSISLFIILRISGVAAANDRPTLYAPGDNVLELDVNTFDRAVYQKVGSN